MNYLKRYQELNVKMELTGSTLKVVHGFVSTALKGQPLTIPNITKEAGYSKGSASLVYAELRKLVEANVLVRVKKGQYDFNDPKNWFRVDSEAKKKLLRDLEAVEKMRAEILGELEELDSSDAA